MLRNSIHNFSVFLKKIFNEHDISKLNLGINKTQTKILMVIIENPNTSMSVISETAGIEKSAFSHSVDQLVESGFITRNYPETNRRMIILALTPKGRKAAVRIKDDLDAYLESLLSGFSAKEKKEFFQLINATSEYIGRILEVMNK